ncbi:MAG: hypothetical protein R3219_09655 [Hydrogenovibrio sp.]|nr:hypothetical protein [Hydrogenovibrio sp.]
MEKQRKKMVLENLGQDRKIFTQTGKGIHELETMEIASMPYLSLNKVFKSNQRPKKEKWR